MRMRYYEYKLPGEEEWIITTRIRGERFPKGTKIRAIVTDRDGTLLDCWEIPLDDEGKPVLRGRSLRRW